MHPPSSRYGSFGRLRLMASSIKLPPLLLLLLLVSCFSVIILPQHQAHAKPNRPLLRGVTFRNWPYADRINDRYEGFVVDLMNLIAQKVGFEYRLYFSPDGKYGTEFNGNINGMIGEVFRNRADFAIADLTVTESRKRYVDFTEPFLENQLAAIIRRDDAVGLRTLEDLVTLNEINHRPDLPPTERRGLLTYGTYRTGATYYHLSKNRDPIARKIYEWMVRNPDALVTSAKEGFDRVNAGRYAFIVESTFAEYLTGIYCNLTMLYDTRSLYPRKFGIALPKGSPYLYDFNKAIAELKATGVIQRLRKKYWLNRCGNNDDNNHLRHLPSTPPPPASPPSTTPTSTTASTSTAAETKIIYDGPDQRRIINDNPGGHISENNNRNGNHRHHHHNMNNGNTGEMMANNGANNAIKIEWAPHQHHQQPPPHLDRNRGQHHHHRMGYHPSSSRNKMNQDFDTENVYYGGVGRRTNGSLGRHPSSSLLSIWLPTMMVCILLPSMFHRLQ